MTTALGPDGPAGQGETATAAAIGPRVARAIVWGGGAVIVATAVAGMVLTLVHGETLYAERLIAGLAGCL
jgi:serine acetyltransferase